METTIILALDGSDGSNKALDWTINFAKSNSAQVHVVTVIDSTSVITLEPERHILEMEEIRRQSLERLNQATQPLCDGHSCSIIRKVLAGNVADEILQYAKENQANMIVCGTRGRGTLKTLLLGSVAHKLVMYAECSVLVVR